MSSLLTHIVWIQWVTDMAACFRSLKHLLVTLQSTWYSATLGLSEEGKVMFCFLNYHVFEIGPKTARMCACVCYLWL